MCVCGVVIIAKAFDVWSMRKCHRCSSANVYISILVATSLVIVYNAAAEQKEAHTQTVRVAQVARVRGTSIRRLAISVVRATPFEAHPTIAIFGKINAFVCVCVAD